MKAKYLTAPILISVLLITPLSANADLADLLGVRKIAEDAGRSAAVEVVKGIDTATRNLAMMTNQFGQLIEDFYGDNPTRAARAKKILEGVFGRTLNKTDDVKLQVTASFAGNVKASDGISADIWPFAYIDHEALKKIALAGASFHGTPIIAAAAPGLTIASVRQTVKNQARIFASRPNTRLDECNKAYPKDATRTETGDGWSNSIPYRSDPQLKKYNECLIEKEAEELTSVIMQVFSNPDLISLKGSVTRDLPGGRFVALVIPKQVLEKFQDKLVIKLWLHQAGDPNKRVGVFKEVVRTIDPVDMLKNIVPTPQHLTPELCYWFVDLKIDAIMGSTYLMGSVSPN